MVTEALKANIPLETLGNVKSYGTHQPNQNVNRTIIGVRHVFVFLGFLGLSVVFMMRVSFSVAIVDMVQSPQIDFNSLINDSSGAYDFCPEKISKSSANYLAASGEFKWDGQTQGWILGSFFWGYMMTQLPGGILADRFGGKNVFGLGVLLGGLCNLFTPFAARSSVPLLLTVRLINGLAEGVTLPAMHNLLSRWIPQSERSTMGSFVMAGMQIGKVISLPLSAFLCSVPLDGGWPLAFYVPGILSIVWFVSWMLLAYDSPQTHPRISAAEKHFLLGNTDAPPEKLSPTAAPWSSIFSSLPLWAIVVAHMGRGWGYTVLQTQLPTYLHTVLHYDLKANGVLSAMPYLVMWLFSILSSLVADLFQTKKCLSTTNTRKLFNSIGFLLPAFGWIIASFTGCNRLATILTIAVGNGFIGAMYSGYHVNHIDIAPSYAGILMGITNSFSALSAFFAPYVVSLIVTTPGSLHQWQTVMFLTAGVYTITNGFYLIFASGEEQLWNRSSKELDIPYLTSL